jgi:hypothetical protein
MKFLNGVLNHKDYVSPTCYGDTVMKENIDYYIEKRNAILANDKIDKQLVLFYENKLIKDNRDAWWHHYSKSYLNKVLWFLKRLTKGLELKSEFDLLKQFYQRLPMYLQRYGQYGMDDLQHDKDIYNKFIQFKK